MHIDVQKFTRYTAEHFTSFRKPKQSQANPSTGFFANLHTSFLVPPILQSSTGDFKSRDDIAQQTALIKAENIPAEEEI